MKAMPSEIWSRLRQGAICLSGACSEISDQFWASQIKLAGNLLIDALNESADGVNARRVRDIGFALDDVRGLISDLVPPEAESFQPCLTQLSSAVEELRRTSSLSEGVVDRLRELRDRAEQRRVAAERAAFRPPEAAAEPLPNDPAELQSEADSLRELLQGEGFETPVLDRLASAPSEFEIRDCAALVDELEPIIAD